MYLHINKHINISFWIQYKQDDQNIASVIKTGKNNKWKCMLLINHTTLKWFISSIKFKFNSNTWSTRRANGNTACTLNQDYWSCNALNYSTVLSWVNVKINDWYFTVFKSNSTHQYTFIVVKNGHIVCMD